MCWPVCLTAGNIGELGGLNYEATGRPMPSHTTCTTSAHRQCLLRPARCLRHANRQRRRSVPANRGAGRHHRPGTQVFVEEETCSDGETNYIAETFGIFAVQTGSPSAAAADPCAGLGSNTDDVPAGPVETCLNLRTGTRASISGYSRANVRSAVLMRGATASSTARSGCLRRHAQDNAGFCTIDNADGQHERQSQDENGCLQNWNNQICGCSGVQASDTVDSPTNCDGSPLTRRPTR